jgi:nitrate/nitrite-specific signal transduction histidine kinase
MRYRARVIGATLDLKSRPGQGTQVTCVFYSPPPETEDAKKPVANELVK